MFRHARPPVCCVKGRDFFAQSRSNEDGRERKCFGGSRKEISALHAKISRSAIWLLALTERARANTLDHFPRRLVYVVTRRTVVDQSTEVAQKLRAALDTPELAEMPQTLGSFAARTSDPDGCGSRRSQSAHCAASSPTTANGATTPPALRSSPAEVDPKI
jgi:hypothetical protein